jgi:hypothetical protein
MSLADFFKIMGTAYRMEVLHIGCRVGQEGCRTPKEATTMVERAAEALRDGEQAANERQQAEIEMEQGLIAQKQRFQRGTNLPIVEQADGSDDTHDDGANSITAGEGHGDENSGAGIGSPGAGTDPSQTQTSSGDADSGPDLEDNREYAGDERTFEGEGRHSLREQDDDSHAFEQQ